MIVPYAIKEERGFVLEVGHLFHLVLEGMPRYVGWNLHGRQFMSSFLEEYLYAWASEDHVILRHFYS